MTNFLSSVHAFLRTSVDLRTSMLDPSYLAGSSLTFSIHSIVCR